MNGKWLLWVRRIHLYLSVFFAPLLLLFIVTGWAQTVGWNKDAPFATTLQELSAVHTSQYVPTKAMPGDYTFGDIHGGDNAPSPVSWPTKALVVAMCLALMVSISLGLVLAFTMVRNRTPVWIALFLGIGTPIAFLTLAHWK